MAVDEQLERLSWQLSRLSLGEIDTIVDQAFFSVGSASAAFAARIRQVAYDQPLITLLLSCQVGYLLLA